ncbi:MAG TPA: DUF2059 domain-containing protein [Bauldia sp.]|jgi:hypothetical protein
MSFVSRIVAIAVVGLGLAAGSSPGWTQEITPTQLAAGLDVVKSAKISLGFDALLPQLAARVEDRLIRVRPDLHAQIISVVEATALKLVDRRAELDSDVARVWSKQFSEDELKTIAAFYKTAAGLKFSALAGPAGQLQQGMVAAVQQWSDRVGAELLDKSREALKAQGIQF